MIRYCDFGTLDKLVLPPYAVSQVNLDVWSSKLRNGINKRGELVKIAYWHLRAILLAKITFLKIARYKTYVRSFWLSLVG